MMQRRSIPILLASLSILGWVLAPAARGQAPSGVTTDDPEAVFPAIPPLSMYGTVDTFRTEVEESISAMRARAASAKAVLALVDTLVFAFDRYGDYMDRQYGDFPNMSRGKPYWIITTDNAADTLTDRVGGVIEAYIKAAPTEKLGLARAQWEMGTDQLGVPRIRLFGFQFVELARRSAVLRRQLIHEHPTEAATFEDANVRFLWDLVQFYRQLHRTWYDRHMMRVADEDWIIHRITGRCKDPKWQVAISLTAIGVDTTQYDPMTDKFMHRLKLVDPDCPDTVDFVILLPHYRLMEKEIGQLSPAQRDSLLLRSKREAENRGSREQRPDAAPRGAPPGDKR